MSAFGGLNFRLSHSASGFKVGSNTLEYLAHTITDVVGVCHYYI